MKRIIEAAEKEVVCATEKYLATVEFAKSPITSRLYASYVQAAFELRRSKLLLERALNKSRLLAQGKDCLIPHDSVREPNIKP